MPDHERALREAGAKYAGARVARDEAIRAASKDGGMSYRAIGKILGLSYSRVAQIVRAD